MKHSRLLLIAAASTIGYSSELPAKPSPTSKEISFAVGPAPSWVKPVPASKEAIRDEESGGVFFLLVDRQENLQPSALYYRDIRKVTAEKGVTKATSIYASFNPAFQKLIVHTVRVIRNGVASDRLDRSQLKLVASEEDQHRFFYRPYYNLQSALDDVRVGDLVEFAYTIEGENPLRRSKCFELFPMQWDVPIGRVVVRVIFPSDRKITFRPRNQIIDAIVSTNKGITEHCYDTVNVPGLNIPEDEPDDYNPRRQLQVSEFNSWAEVAQWALPLFESDAAYSRDLDEEITKLNAIPNAEQRVVAALEFVQRELPSVAFDDVGPAGHPTTPLGDVLRHRYADYKDKAVLLTTLLSRTGIEAAPALVSYTYRGLIRDFLPSPRPFDHAIVQVLLNQSTYWLDPTRSNQRGPLPQIYIANFGQALVLRPGTQTLVECRAPRSSWSSTRVTENFRIQRPGQDSELDVVSEYRGFAADRIRGSFRDQTHEEIQKHYLEYYLRDYPEVKVDKPLWYEEIPGENACRVTESYVVPQIWHLSDDKDRYRLVVRPGDISSVLGSTALPRRNDPLRLNFPNEVVQQINLEMFETWPFEGKPETTATDFFRLREEPKASGSYIQLNYSVEILKDRVEVGELAKFNQVTDNTKESLDYTLTYRTPEQRAKTEKHTLNWAVAAASLCFFGMASFIAVRYFRDSKLAHPLPPPIDATAALNGIRGWLILLAIGHFLRPLGPIKTAYDLWPTMFYTAEWRTLTDPIESSYNAWWAPALLFELFLTIASLVLCALLIALFFRKRFAWRRCFVFFLVFAFAGDLLEIVFDHLTPSSESFLSVIPSLVGTLIGAAIWIPYVYRSKRVKATFRY